VGWCEHSVFKRSFQINQNRYLKNKKMPRLHNRKYLKPLRKNLRNNSTSAEATLWKMLKKSQVGGYKFRRQHSIGNFIMDFYCPALKLAIEVDGEPHAQMHNIARDTVRDDFLNNNKITVLRYENRWVFEYPEVIKQDVLDFGEKLKKDSEI
jgi:very-short-patch-repair endonuclease